MIQKLKTLIFIMGIIYSVKKSWTFLQLLTKKLFYICFNKKQKFNKYGQGSYVFITGSSDGIGKEFAHQFAELGFNLILLGRNQQKLDNLYAALKKKHEDCDIKTISIDFYNYAQESNLFDKLYQQIKNVDISILVNCAGIADFEFFENQSQELLRKLLIINCSPTLMLTHLIATQFFFKRQKRSGIINVSSYTGGAIPLKGYAAYGATKAFVTSLTRVIQDEFKGKNIDIIDLAPLDVSTNQTFYRPEDFQTSTPKDCVDGTLQDFGWVKSTYGSWRHQFLASLIEFLPQPIFRFVWNKFLVQMNLNEYRGNKNPQQQEQNLTQNE